MEGTCSGTSGGTTFLALVTSLAGAIAVSWDHARYISTGLGLEEIRRDKIITCFPSLLALVRLIVEPFWDFALGFKCLDGGTSGISSSSLRCSTSGGIAWSPRMGCSAGIFPANRICWNLALQGDRQPSAFLWDAWCSERKHLPLSYFPSRSRQRAWFPPGLRASPRCPRRLACLAPGPRYGRTSRVLHPIEESRDSWQALL